MNKLFALVVLFCLTSMVSQLDAQSINNRNWIASFGNPINDSLILHVQSDSTYVTNSSGDVIIHTSFTISGDTLSILDKGTGEHECPDMVGKYKINLDGNSFMLTVIDDPCEGRGQALNGVKWTETMKK